MVWTRMSSNPPSILSVEKFRSWASTLPEEVKRDYGRLSFTVSAVIMKHFFGVEWMERNVIQDEENKQPHTFLRLDFTNDTIRETKSFRMVMFAETLLNLQGVPGFYDRINDMKTADLEACMAEFDFARFLNWHSVDFSFVKPSGVKGADYDFEIRHLNGCVVCADVKCRLEGTVINPKTIRNSLDDARKRNLPGHKPGMIFVKVPQTWLATPDLQNQIADVVRIFLRGTKKIVAVTVYASLVEVLNDPPVIRSDHPFNEYTNPNHRFGLNQNWRLFDNYQAPPEWHGAPPNWIRLFP